MACVARTDYYERVVWITGSNFRGNYGHGLEDNFFLGLVDPSYATSYNRSAVSNPVARGTSPEGKHEPSAGIEGCEVAAR